MRTVRRAGLAVSCLVLLLAGTSLAQGRAHGKYPTWERSSQGFSIRPRGGVQFPRSEGGIWIRSGAGVFYPGTGFRPPGWDRGQKTGWGNCNLPPGLAKKSGCIPSYGVYRNRISGIIIQGNGSRWPRDRFQGEAWRDYRDGWYEYRFRWR